MSLEDAWRLDRALVAELDAMPTDLVVDVIKALQAAAAELVANTDGSVEQRGDPMFVLTRAGGEALADQWDRLQNEAEARLTGPGAGSRDLIDLTWDPSWRAALAHWAQLNEGLLSEGRRWAAAFEAAARVSCSDYLAALADAGEEAVNAALGGLLPCSPQLVATHPEVAEGVMRLWRVTSVHSPVYAGNAALERTSEERDEPEANSAPTAGRDRPTTTRAPTRPAGTPGTKGTVLEEGLFEVLTSLFDLDEATTGQPRAALRRQLAGTQFGTDLIVRTRAVGSSSTCLLECKNYQAPIKSKDIADKILAASDFYESEPIDYWVLISPHSDPANDLDLQVQKWNTDRRFPFQIQIWSPQSGVRNLFALSPRAFTDLYGTNTPRPKVDASAVVADFRSRLRPWLRVPASVDGYLRSPTSLTQPNEREWLPMLETSIERRGLDADGRPLDSPLQEVIIKALEPTNPAPTALLTADFGEGKSFFTVSFCHALRERFLANPTPANPIPFRFHLKGFRKVDDASEFLSRQLQQIGVSLAEWTSLTQQWNVLVVLDGMDEMSVSLDIDTTRANFAKVSDLLDQLDGLPVLVTTRPNFFGSDRDRERFYDRLRRPVTYQLTQPERRETVAHLRGYANTHELGAKLERIKELYDPIGLAGKVLFLEMIKTTLPDLPEDRFNERILYETYIDRSFLRKVELLRDPEDALTDAELFEQLTELLERVAIAIHTRGEGVVDLREFLADAGGATALLWKSAERPDDAAEEDAARRVGGRSLLRRLPQMSEEQTASAGEAEWRVDFFHRSMKEYFVARALVRALSADDAFAATRSLLKEIKLQPEIVSFFHLMLDELDEPEAILSSIAHSAGLQVDGGLLGGAAATLFNAAGGSFGTQAWSDLNLDGALLVRADLACVDLRRSTLRGASLASADLTGADLRGCDLTDANLGMNDVIIDLQDAVSGGFLGLTSGAALTRVRLDHQKQITVNDVVDSLSLQRPRRVLNTTETTVLATGDAQVCVVLLSDHSGEEVASFRIANAIRDLDLVDATLLGLLVADDYGGLRALLVDLSDGTVQWARHVSSESRSCRWNTEGVVAASNHGLIWHPAEGGTRLVAEHGAITSSRIAPEAPYKNETTPAALYGTTYGYIGLTRLGEDASHADRAEVSTSPVSSLAIDGSTVLVASADGSIAVWEVGDGSLRRTGVAERRLRCDGALVTGLMGPREKELFAANGARG